MRLFYYFPNVAHFDFARVRFVVSVGYIFPTPYLARCSQALRISFELHLLIRDRICAFCDFHSVRPYIFAQKYTFCHAQYKPASNAGELGGK